MTTDTTATATSTAQEGPTYRGHAYYKDDENISTINTVGYGSSSRYYSSYSNNVSHRITKYQVVDATDNESVASGTTLESFQAVTSEIFKTQVYIRYIMEHLSLPADVIPTGNNLRNKSFESSDTTGNIP